MHRQKIIARILLVCAVLFAQQTALAHDFWHASKSTPASSQPAKGDKLCDLHDLLGTVLGVAGATAVAHDLACSKDVAFPAVAVGRARVHSLAPQSRGPPAIS